ncbi:MAG: hypothetical protein AAES65_09090 [Candidatus Thiodiazotropha sp. (ex. Lucinoma kazani)]
MAMTSQHHTPFVACRLLYLSCEKMGDTSILTRAQQQTSMVVTNGNI